MSKDVWVFVETDADGNAKRAGLELLNPGKGLAEKQGGELVAVMIGQGLEAAVKEAAAYGADKAITVEGDEYKQYSTDAYAYALCELIKKYDPQTVMIGATNTGRDLAPRCSSRLKTGLTADCTAVSIDEESGNVVWTRPTFGGNLMA